MAALTPAQLEKDITLTKRDRIALITLNLPRKLNAVTQQHYWRIALLLDDVAADPHTTITLVTGTGRFFSAGADVSAPREPPPSSTGEPPRQFYARTFAASNLHNARSWYTHPKVLVCALNGPAVGMSAALLAHCDFVYAAPHAYLLTPFSSLGLVAEGASSVAFVERMGSSLARDALLSSRRVACEELVRSGFVNKVFAEGGGDANGKGFDAGRFLDAVVAEVEGRLGEHLNRDSLLGIKRLLVKGQMERLERANADEVWAGVECFERGSPQREFARIASGEKRHKL